MVIPYVTQMAWLKYPLIFCVASETARDTTENNIDKPVDGLDIRPHKEFMASPGKRTEEPLDDIFRAYRHLLEVYMDYFIALA